RRSRAERPVPACPVLGRAPRRRFTSAEGAGVPRWSMVPALLAGWARSPVAARRGGWGGGPTGRAAARVRPRVRPPGAGAPGGRREARGAAGVGWAGGAVRPAGPGGPPGPPPSPWGLAPGAPALPRGAARGFGGLGPSTGTSGRLRGTAGVGVGSGSLVF